MSTRLLVVCGEPLGERMASPAIRALELSRVAAGRGVVVTIAAPAGQGAAPLAPGVNRVALSNQSLRAELDRQDCVLAGATLLSRFPALVGSELPIAVDLYDPVPLEAAELYRDAPAGVVDAILAEVASTLRLELSRADVVLCANDRQRELWLGGMLASGRLTHDGYAADPSLSGLIRVVPFGVQADPPQKGAAFRGEVDGIRPGDQVAVWAGGMHDWFDPETVVAAVAQVAADMPKLRVVFMGAAPPNQRLQQHAAAERARQAAEAAGLLDKHVFFYSTWVPYASRGAFLLDADVGLSAHRDTAETRYAWRTRLLDYTWAGLPVVATSGDALSGLLAQRGAAELSAPGDVAGFAAALKRMLGDNKRRQRAGEASATLGQELRWEVVAQPLLDWVANPVRTAGEVSAAAASLALWRMYMAKGWHVMRTEGVSGLRRRARRYRDQA